MPVLNGVGYSEMTPDKQEGFAKYINLNIRIWRHVFDRNPCWYRRYVYIDLTCGSGMDPTGLVGSPILFIENASIFQDIKFDCHFIDREDGNIKELKSQIKLYKNISTQTYCKDNKEVDSIINHYDKNQLFGLVYMDFNGIPDFNLLGNIANKTKRMDLLIRCPTRCLKRSRYQGKLSLVDEIKRVNREVWLIREKSPLDKRLDWTFLFGTNYSDYNEWGKLGFYRTDKPMGIKTLERLSYTQEEIRDMNQPILDMGIAIQQRNDGLCEKCGKRKATQRHHIKYDGSHNPEKLIGICYKCHCELEGVEE